MNKFGVLCFLFGLLHQSLSVNLKDRFDQMKDVFEEKKDYKFSLDTLVQAFEEIAEDPNDYEEHKDAVECVRTLKNIMESEKDKTPDIEYSEVKHCIDVLAKIVREDTDEHGEYDFEEKAKEAIETKDELKKFTETAKAPFQKSEL